MLSGCGVIVRYPPDGARFSKVEVWVCGISLRSRATRYSRSSVLLDRDDAPSGYVNHKVNILRLMPKVPAGQHQKASLFQDRNHKGHAVIAMRLLPLSSASLFRS
jgi:hypothetical protein